MAGGPRYREGRANERSEARWKIEGRELSCKDALFLNYLEQEMEAKCFAYLVQTQRKECLKGREEVRLPSVRMTIV